MPPKPPNYTVQILPFTGKKKCTNPAKKKTLPQAKPRDSSGPPADRKAGIDPESHRIAWRDTFGSRLVIDDTRGFYLDGRPVTTGELMRITNRSRKKNGLPPIGKNKDWW